ncbi:hypothetical protein F5Y09DRAFT_312324 [Xylaria sp. FL1042]|nr:hypothetical protein F5Y09DRAFT_312324 [Xylaria sp. FL1042]
MQERLKLLGRNYVFSSPHGELDRIELEDTAKSSAEHLLHALEVPELFQRSIVAPCVEASFGLNIKEAGGLHIVASMGSSRSQPVAIMSGNEELVSRMLRESKAAVHIDSQVTKVESGGQRRFALTIASTKSTQQTRDS